IDSEPARRRKNGEPYVRGEFSNRERRAGATHSSVRAEWMRREAQHRRYSHISDRLEDAAGDGTGIFVPPAKARRGSGQHHGLRCTPRRKSPPQIALTHHPGGRFALAFASGPLNQTKPELPLGLRSFWIAKMENGKQKIEKRSCRA